MAEIRIARQEDIERIALCHRNAFPRSLSSALGLEYIQNMLNWYLSSDTTFLFFFEEDNMCVGYCGGMIKKVWGVGSASSMAQFSFNAALKGFLLRPWLTFHPEVWVKFSFIVKNITNRFINKKKLIGEPNVVFEPYAGLVVIGVDPAYQKKGYGSLMLQHFEQLTIKRGIRKMVLSVRSDNNQAIASYVRNGWVVSEVNGKSTSMEKLSD